MSAKTIDSDVEFIILKRVSDGPVPVYDSDAVSIAPITRWAEIIGAGFLDGKTIEDGDGIPCKVAVLGLTYPGRNRLSELERERESMRPVSVMKRWAGRAVWAVLGVAGGIAGTLFTQWLSKKLGL